MNTPEQPAPGEPKPNPPAPPEPPAIPQPPPVATEPPPMPAGAPPPAAGSSTTPLGAQPPVFDPPPGKDETLIALFIHLGGALGSATAYIGLPGGSLLVPLILWLAKKDGSRFIDDQGKEVLNFQICVFVLSWALILTCVGAPLAWVLSVIALVLGIVGAIKANDGIAYRYPLNLRMIK
jgi:uncharacterized Tic20 family protein